MKGRVLGFSLLLLLLLLMLSALVVSSGEELPEVKAAPLASVERLLPASPASGTETPPSQNRALRILPAPQARLPFVKNADANGVPLNGVSYVRANFTAFRLSDSAG